MTHLIACFWYFSSQNSHHTNTWVSIAGIDNSPWYIKYLYAMYWACVTLMTVGCGEIIPQNTSEILTCIISIFIGCLVYTYTLSNIIIILQNINKNTIDFDRKMSIINEFMIRKQINNELQIRIRQYLKLIWQVENTQNMGDEQKIIGLLSSSLKEELLINANGLILKNLPKFFSNFTEKSLRKIATIISDKQCYPEEELVFNEKDEDTLSIYFIIKGKIELFTETGINLNNFKGAEIQ